MANRPHDGSDLFLAPVALQIDARLDELATLDDDSLKFRVALEGNVDLANADLVAEGVVNACTNGIDLHHWEAVIDPRGLRLRHDDHTLVIGLPTNVRALLGH